MNLSAYFEKHKMTYDLQQELSLLAEQEAGQYGSVVSWWQVSGVKHYLQKKEEFERFGIKYTKEAFLNKYVWLGILGMAILIFLSKHFLWLNAFIFLVLTSCWGYGVYLIITNSPRLKLTQFNNLQHFMMSGAAFFLVAGIEGNLRAWLLILVSIGIIASLYAQYQGIRHLKEKYPEVF